jgi:hypothetical protein
MMFTNAMMLGAFGFVPSFKIDPMINIDPMIVNVYIWFPNLVGGRAVSYNRVRKRLNFRVQKKST